MSELNFEDIRPYTDAEALVALKRIAESEMVNSISAYLWPGQDPEMARNILRSCKDIDAFQSKIMIPAIEAVLAKSSKGLSFGGIDILKGVEGRFLAITNHRDIVCDPAFFQYMLFTNGLPFSDICIGSNLLDNKFVEDVMRINRMIKVNRGIAARELYLSSLRLSAYMRQVITSGERSVWIAQKEGRTKNGIDRTSQGVLKMLDMSGEESFDVNFGALKIVPIAISYEYEPCDILKARELYLSRTSRYIKQPGEDMMSILTGIRQPKGHIHMEAAPLIGDDELREASKRGGNERYQFIMKLMDRRIAEHYKLWKTNYIAADMVEGGSRYAGLYDAADKEAFGAYLENRLDSVGPDFERAEMRHLLLGIYANPVKVAESL
jgi:hypothetical protein